MDRRTLWSKRAGISECLFRPSAASLVLGPAASSAPHQLRAICGATARQLHRQGLPSRELNGLRAALAPMGWPNLPLRRRTAPASVNTSVTLEDGGMERCVGVWPDWLSLARPPAAASTACNSRVIGLHAVYSAAGAPASPRAPRRRRPCRLPPPPAPQTGTPCLATICRSRSVGGELGRFFKDIRAAPDRGKSFYQAERNRQHLASLVEAGRCDLTSCWCSCVPCGASQGCFAVD